MPTQDVIPFLMFTGRAEEAMRFYVSVFDRSEIVSIQRYGPNEAGTEGTVLHATFSLRGRQFMAIDSYIEHAFTFTPAISFYVACDTADEVSRLFESLAQEGQVLMPLGPYPFNQHFGWVQDKYGVSWQLAMGA